MSNIYLQAIRAHLRFSTSRGFISVEDLVDVPLEARDGYDLDTIAKAVNRDIKASDEESFVKTKVDKNLAENQLRMEILKDVISFKLAEKTAKVDAVAKSAELQKLLALRGQKADEALANLSAEELDARIKACQAA